MQPRHLYKHQIEAMDYCYRYAHPALFMDMRLGKTPVAIRRISAYTPRSVVGLKVLVVAPSTVLHVWSDELEKECEDYTLLTGTKPVRKKRLAENHRWYLMNKEGFLAIPEVADFWRWDAVVLDESTFIKNPKAKVTKFFLKNFRNVPHRWILTGLPNPESDMEIFCQLAFLDGYAFGCRNFWEFRARFYEPNYIGYEWCPKPGTEDIIRDTVSKRCFVLRRSQVLEPIPPTYAVRKLEIPKALKETYEKAEEMFILEYKGQVLAETLWSLEKYTWLRAISSGWIGDSMQWPGKFEELLNLLDGELKGQQVVVWFTFNRDLELAFATLFNNNYKAAMLHGASSLSERSDAVRRFASREIQILLLQVAIAQYGLNLSSANTAIYFQAIPSLSMRKQSEDRIFLPEKKEPLLYIDLVTKDTVEEDIASALISKELRATRTVSRSEFLRVLDAMMERRRQCCSA